jgi:hypothetical protein
MDGADNRCSERYRSKDGLEMATPEDEGAIEAEGYKNAITTQAAW